MCRIFLFITKMKSKRVKSERGTTNTDEERGLSCNGGPSSDLVPDLAVPQN